jgi:aspartyl-tRNA(Asn)/glutamyl-tRNA(Gln) amidotransferase subunit A
MPAHAIADAIRRGERRAVDVVGDALESIDASDLDAFTTVHVDRARRRAADIDRSVAGGADPGPLAGVPIALKDLIDHEGEVTTAGSAFYRHEAEASATAVARLEAAGAVIVGRTNLHEFAYGFSSENPWFGPVRNPWDRATSAGGSSGGSAAAVAGGLAPLAIGTDTGGSVRVPAALTATMGLKVTHGRIPLTGVLPLAASLDTVGPIATTVQDLDLAYRAMRGADPADPWSVHGAPVPRAAHVPLRIGVPRPWVGTGPVDPSIIDAFDAAMAGLAGHRLEVVDVDLPNLVPFGRINELAGAQAARVHREWLSKGREYGAEVGDRIRTAMEVGVDDLVDALAWQAGMRDLARQAFADVDVLATPSVGALRKVIGDDHITFGGDQHAYRPVLSWFSALVNALGVPAISLPLVTSGAPPPSIQLIAPWWCEETLIALGRRLEREGVVGTRHPTQPWWG